KSTAVLTLIHVLVNIADDWVADLPFCTGEQRHWADVHHLMHGRRERETGACHAPDPRAPNAAADDDYFRLVIATAGAPEPHAAALDLDPNDLGVGRDRQRSGLLCVLAHDRPGA